MHENKQSHVIWPTTRRDFLARSGAGFGGLALSSMMAWDSAHAEMPQIDPLNPLGARLGHFAPRARSVIFLFMEGGPSHIDLFDPKPALEKWAGKPLPESIGPVFTPMGVGSNTLLPSKRKFARHGESGMWVSDWYPNVAEVVDDICLIRSCWCDGINHVGSVCQMNTGSILAGRPSLGAWVSYGLGTENENLPSFVVMCDAGDPTGGPRNWGTGWMPATFQGTPFRRDGSPILYLDPARSSGQSTQKTKLEGITELDRMHLQGREDDTRLSARIAAYELAYRMQAEAPEAVDLSGETEETKSLYGLDDERSRTYGQMCLRARRLVERGVRFVQCYSGSGSQWDAHGDIEENHGRLCPRSDKPVAGLIKDLKRRGLLDSTLVVWGGEFGRTPMNERTRGRDHNPYGFSMFMAGGGIKPGLTFGTTDEFGLKAIEGRVHVHDIHATILHQLGLDHKRLTFPRDGRDERLTINGGRVIKEILA
ncbi:DUF1501 domain-containing protein [bacterium]|nr:DUF1501 domain-containing protein [bacterium]